MNDPESQAAPEQVETETEPVPLRIAVLASRLDSLLRRLELANVPYELRNSTLQNGIGILNPETFDIYVLEEHYSRAKEALAELEQVPVAKPRRPVVQLRLSTCLLLMFSAGWLVMKNVLPREKSLITDPSVSQVYGWPWIAREDTWVGVQFYADALFGDIVFALLSLLLIAYCAEKWSRRRESTECSDSVTAAQNP
ncbi:MAG TPA: hypothetical protein VEK08_06720 [Planctomycetota bacterium]|nr:hypothetical protein [Planctomycetota bacterium]